MEEHYSHRACTFIMPDVSRRARSARGDPYPTDMPQYMRDRTHGCWCSSWRMTEHSGLLVWRRGAWRRPKPGELVRVRGASLARLRLLLGER